MAPADATPADGEPLRLSKVVAARVPCSRREAEQYIAEGRVRVDGAAVHEPQFRVRADQRVEIDTQAQLQPPVPATVLVHKPAGSIDARALIEAATRWKDDPTGIRRVKSQDVGLVALFALPPQASGLCVYSQDGRIVRKLTEDAALMEQELLADVSGSIAPGGLERLGHGLVRDGKPLPAARVSWQSEHRLRFAAKGLMPALVPWMCAQVGLELIALRRIRIGRIAMAGLPVGQWRYLGPHERF